MDPRGAAALDEAADLAQVRNEPAGVDLAVADDHDGDDAAARAGVECALQLVHVELPRRGGTAQVPDVSAADADHGRRLRDGRVRRRSQHLHARDARPHARAEEAQLRERGVGGAVAGQHQLLAQ